MKNDQFLMKSMSFTCLKLAINSTIWREPHTRHEQMRWAKSFAILVFVRHFTTSQMDFSSFIIHHIRNFQFHLWRLFTTHQFFCNRKTRNMRESWLDAGKKILKPDIIVRWTLNWHKSKMLCEHSLLLSSTNKMTCD